MNLQPVTLEGKRVTLLPLHEAHIPGLIQAANDPNIWTNIMTPLLSPDAVQAHVHQALVEQQTGQGIPFTVFDKTTDSIVGCTRLFDISVPNRGLEIGHTWYNPSVWRTRVNTECKYLLLGHCFETFNLLRVQIKTDLRNERSQAAIARLGATKEGILRKHRVLYDGYVRDTVMFSILDSEWPQVKDRLEGFLSK